MDGLAGMNTRRMPWLQGLRHQPVHEPIGDRLGHKRIPHSRCSRRKGPMWKWTDLLVASDFYPETRLYIIRIVSCSVEITRNPGAGRRYTGQPGFDIPE